MIDCCMLPCPPAQQPPCCWWHTCHCSMHFRFCTILNLRNFWIIMRWCCSAFSGMHNPTCFPSITREENTVQKEHTPTAMWDAHLCHWSRRQHRVAMHKHMASRARPPLWFFDRTHQEIKQIKLPINKNCLSLAALFLATRATTMARVACLVRHLHPRWQHCNLVGLSGPLGGRVGKLPGGESLSI